MSTQSPVIEVEYPESDGTPMGETDLHRKWMIHIIDLLQFRYRNEQAYVSGDLLIYYEEGDPRKFVVPDAFVVLDCAPYDRRVFKVWEEGRAPNVAIETTSRSTRAVDQTTKPVIYQQLGIPEYFLYDPTSDYLDPPLQGHRLRGRRYEPIPPDASGRLVCRELGLHFQLDDRELVMTDATSGHRLLTEAEFLKVENERLRQLLRRHEVDE